MLNDQFYLIKCHDPDEAGKMQPIPCFSSQELRSTYLWSSQMLGYSNYLDKLVFRIARKPNRLISHVQRIMYCFHANLNEQLFAALIDFLIILNRRGQSISLKMVLGSQSRLQPKQLKILKRYLADPNYDPNQLPGNKYSIFARGMVGGFNLIMMPKQHNASKHDPLALARDHIEYSQLEEAKQVLEDAVLNDPERLALHHELLMLYQLTGDGVGFDQMYAKLAGLGFAMPDKWSDLKNYFEKANSNG